MRSSPSRKTAFGRKPNTGGGDLVVCKGREVGKLIGIMRRGPTSGGREEIQNLSVM